MTIISASDTNLLRGKLHKSQSYMSVEVPETSWQGTITTDPARFEDVIQFNSGSGDVNKILKDCEVWIGVGINSKSRGTVRLREFNSGDGITGNIKVSANNYDFVTGDMITIKLSFRLRPLFPLISGDGLSAQFFKDGDIAYNGQNLNLNPIVIAGGNRAMFLDNATINPHFENSYAVSDGATITNYQITPYTVSGGSVTLNYDTGTGVGDFTFNNTGSYWVQYKITDSNGTEQISYRFYRVHDINDFPMINFGMSTISGAWDSAGYNCSIKPYDDTTLLDIDDETICIIWEVASYNGTGKSITVLPDNANTLISGYFRKESIDRNLKLGVGNVTFSIETINKLLENHFMFSASIEARDTNPTEWWQFRNTLTVTRAVHNYLLWQSTLLSVCDLIGVNLDLDMLRPYCEFSTGSLYSQVNGLLENTGIRHKLISDHGGSLHISPVLALLTSAEKDLLSEGYVLEMSDGSEQETIIRNTIASTALTRVSGFSWGGSWNSANCSDASTWCPSSEPHCAVSSEFPDDFGDKIVNMDRQTLRDQNHANELAGLRWGDLNNLYPDVRLKLHGNYFNIFDPAMGYYYTKEYQQVDTIRGFQIVGKKAWLMNVTTTINPLKGTSKTNIVLRIETTPLDGIFEECVLDFPNNSGESPTTGIITEGTNCGETLYTAGDDGFHRLSNCSSPSYTQTTSEPTYDMRVDPYHWSRPWRCGEGFIKRSEDYGTTWVDVTPQNPPNDAGDSPAPTSADLIFEHMDVSYPNEGEFVFLANWDQNRTWIVHTMDNGDTWVWEAIGGLSSGFGTTTSLSGWILENIGNCHMFALDGYCFIAANTYADNTVRLIDSTGDVLNITDSFITDSYLSIMTQLTNTKFVIASIMPGNNLNLQIMTVTGCTTMNVSLPLTVIGNVEMFSITTLDLDKIAIATQDTTTNHLTLHIYQVTTVFTLLDSIVFDNSGNGSLIHFYYFGTYTNGIVVNSIEIGLLRYHSTLDNSTGSELTRLKFDFSGGVLTTPDPPFILYNTTGEARSLKSVPLDSSHYIDVIGPIPYARLVNIDTPLVGLPSGVLNYPSTDSAGFVMQGDIIPYDTSQVLLLATNHTNQGDDPGSSAWLTMLEYDIPTLTLSLSPIEDATELVDKSSHRWGALMLRDVDSQIITMTGNLLKWNLTSYNAGSEGGVDIQDSLEGLGIALSRESANVIYLTLMDHTTSKLYTFTYDVPLAFNTNTVIKDGVTSQQLTDRTFWAFPVSDWFSDDTCHIHGRFSHPDVLNHSIKTLDGGATWLDNGADVGDDHVSSLFNYLDGTQQIVRSKVSGVSQLYLVNDGVLNFRSNIPFLQHVAPHSMAVGSGGSYFGSLEAQNYMVTKTIYPLTSWANYTFNHQVSGRILSVEVPK